ncbi:uncharacterized protein [Amphiura filiformis]|uniref:uncharacterized protein n=1 Tax=Amphiura filiformis TaxID=82378 RepID=UPI003B218D03
MTIPDRILLICFIAGFSWQIPECSVGAQEYDGYIATITLIKGDGRHEYSSDIKAITVYQAGEISSTANIQVVTGDTIALRCRLEAHGTWFLDNDVRQEWEFRDNDAGRETISRNGKKVIVNRRIKVKENRDKYEWTVTLKNTKKSDSGRWNCFISPDRFGTRVVARANVQIFDTLASTSGPPLAPCNATIEDTNHDKEGVC